MAKILKVFRSQIAKNHETIKTGKQYFKCWLSIFTISIESVKVNKKWCSTTVLLNECFPVVKLCSADFNAERQQTVGSIPASLLFSSAFSSSERLLDKHPSPDMISCLSTREADVPSLKKHYLPTWHISIVLCGTTYMVFIAALQLRSSAVTVFQCRLWFLQLLFRHVVLLSFQARCMH